MTETQRTPVQLWGPREIGGLFGVTGQTVSAWLPRYRDWYPTPVPDFTAAVKGGTGGPVSLWLPEREQEWREWEAGRPGQGRDRPRVEE